MSPNMIRAATLFAVCLGASTRQDGPPTAEERVGTDSERLRQVEAKLDRLIESLGRTSTPPSETSRPPAKTEVDEEVDSPKKQRMRMLYESHPKRPAAQMALAGHASREKRNIILNVYKIDISRLEDSKGVVEYRHFSLKRGRAYYPDGREIEEEMLWEMLPSSPSPSPRGVPVVVASDEGIFKTSYLRGLKRDTIVLVGEATFEAVGVGGLPWEHRAEPGPDAAIVESVRRSADEAGPDGAGEEDEL